MASSVLLYVSPGFCVFRAQPLCDCFLGWWPRSRKAGPLSLSQCQSGRLGGPRGPRGVRLQKPLAGLALHRGIHLRDVTRLLGLWQARGQVGGVGTCTATGCPALRAPKKPGAAATFYQPSRPCAARPPPPAAGQASPPGARRGAAGAELSSTEAGRAPPAAPAAPPAPPAPLRLGGRVTWLRSAASELLAAEGRREDPQTHGPSTGGSGGRAARRGAAHGRARGPRARAGRGGAPGARGQRRVGVLPGGRR